MNKQVRHIKAWYESKNGDGSICAKSEEVLMILRKKAKYQKNIGYKN
tara:strand:+ start:3582 stop:3722 length:141 start_codon:yes stop_codon:yes gene_type:complete